MKVNVAIFGYGHWGPNLVRNFNKFSNCNVCYVADKNVNKLKKAKKLYPNIKCITDPAVAIKDKSIDAIVIALPVSQHYKYAKLALENNKHLLIEKPATDSKTKLQKLIKISKKKSLFFMVDYTFLYTPAVQKIKELIDSDTIGDILFINAQRMNLGIFRKDVNVIWDLAVHDISIIQYLLNKEPKSIKVNGMSYINSKIIDLAYITLKYSKKQIVHISSSWLYPFKNKKMVIGGSKKTIIYDDVEPIKKIKVYNKGYNVCSYNNIEYKTDDINNICIPKLSQQEALYMVCKKFLDSIRYNKSTISADENFALKVSSVLDACNKSITNNGKEIKL